MNQLTQLSVGDVISGFKLEKMEDVAAVGSTLYTLRHEKTGAQLLYSKRDCDNKTFAVAFETLPENHTGVFHILEHSVLNGSDKYPLKEPFVTLLQSSLQTFLNAMTFNDKTVYPVSSRNEQDFQNLMKVYLDAVFCPSIYKKPEIFEQEGWHFELTPENEIPSYNGVVYSEMKGAFSSVDGLMEEELQSLLFPDTCYHFCSGGHPDYITDLTYEEFIATHKRFYHPSNARFFLDGDLDIDAALQYIDGEYLSKYEAKQPDFAITEQTPVVASKQICYQATSEEESFAHLAFSKIVCRFDDYEKIYAIKVLCDYLTGTNNAPLSRAILEAGLGQIASAGLMDGIYQPFVVFEVRNTQKENFEAIKTTLTDTVKRLAEEGIDRKALLACLERLAFRCREASEPYGLELGIKALESWLYGGDPTAHWNTGVIFESLREKLDGRYFEELLLELFGEPSSMCRLEALPSFTKQDEDMKREEDKLRAVSASWDEAERAEVIDAFSHLTQWQQTPDSPEVIQSLPSLNVCDIPKKAPELTITVEKCLGCDVVHPQTDTHGIVYLDLYFSLKDFDVRELRMAKVFNAVLGELSTETYSAAELQDEIKTWLGSFYGGVVVNAKDGDPNDCTPSLHITASMLEENVEQGFALVKEMLLHTRYDETDRVQELLLQEDYGRKQSLISNGHSYALSRASAPFSVAATLQELLGGASEVDWHGTFTAEFNEKGDEVMKELSGYPARILTRSRLSVSIGGTVSEEMTRSLLEAFPEGEPVTAASYALYDDKESFIEIPSGVNYCGMAHNLSAMGYHYSGSSLVLSTLMSFGYLWNAVRVQGGAYGTGLLVGATGDIACYSYRDPNPEGTVAAFRQMADFIEAFCSSDPELDGFIIGTIGKTEPLLGPGAMCGLAMGRFLRGTTYEELCRIRSEILATDVEALRKLIPMLRTMADDGAVCVVGAKQ